jgi:hypothetical protein
MTPDLEQSLVDMAAMSENSRAMSQALLDGDMEEARFRAKSVQAGARQSGDWDLERAATVVVRLLGSPGTVPDPACAAAVLTVSVRLGERLDGCI